MAFPVKTKARVTWTPASAIPQITSRGWCADRWFTDARQEAPAKNMAEPPPASEQFWLNATVSGIRIIPELRGAILRPETYYGDAEDYLVPCTSDFVQQAWGDPWYQQRHDGIRYNVALWSPDDLDTDDEGFFRTGDAPAERSFTFMYQLFPPEPNSDDTLRQFGCQIIWGITGAGMYDYAIDMPVPNAANADSEWWTLYRDHGSSYQRLDRIPAPALRADEMYTAPQADFIRIMPVQGHLVIQHSRLNGCWVYARGGGVWPRGGQIAFRFYGCRGWCIYGKTVYPAAATIQGPTQPWSDGFTQAGSALSRVMAVAKSGEFSSTVTVTTAAGPPATVRVQAALTNDAPLETVTVGGYSETQKRRWSPLLVAVQEVHEAALGTGSGSDTDLSEYAESLSINDPGGVGTTASVALRNFTSDDGATRGALDSVVKGCGKLTIELAHQYDGATADDDWWTAFVGRVTTIRRGFYGNMEPQIMVAAADRSWLLDGDLGAMVDLPNFAGWDFRDAVTLVLKHFGVAAADITFDSYVVGGVTYDYDDFPRTVPIQQASGAFGFEASDSATGALDALCERCLHKWYVGRDNAFHFIPSPLAAGDVATVFTLDADTVTPEDRVEVPVDAEIDFTRMRNSVRVRGRGGFGQDIWAWVAYGPSLSDTAAADYAGQWLTAAFYEPDNPDPNTTALRKMYEFVANGGVFTWHSITRQVWPGQVVQWDLEFCGLPAGQLVQIMRKGTNFSPEGGDLIATDEFACRLVTGGLVL